MIKDGFFFILVGWKLKYGLGYMVKKKKKWLIVCEKPKDLIPYRNKLIL